MNTHRWRIACLALFAGGVYLLATVPIKDGAWQLATGWALLLASFVALARALPEDDVA